MTKPPKIDFSRVLDDRTWSQLTIGDCYSESMFVDSGAYSLFNTQVLKRNGEILGKHGKPLEQPTTTKKDYSWYDLSPGSELRAYLAKYAALIEKCGDKHDTFFVTVDAIGNPNKSWEIHQFFFKEFGIWLVPVIHHGATRKEMNRYLDTGHCDFLGMGGLGHQTGITRYTKWADAIYKELCPESNGFKPLVKMHGFAMTSWELICRYPWWSVDSATWVKLAAFGWVLVPRYKNGAWRFDRAPYQVNMSRKPTDRKTKFHWRQGVNSPRQTKDKHIDNVPLAMVQTTERWLEAIGCPLGSFHKDGSIKEIGATSDGVTRSLLNLHYFKLLEESRPPWPYPLSIEIRGNKKYRPTFGI